MKVFRLALIPAVIASVCSVAHAEDDNRIYLAPMGSYVLGDNNRPAGDGYGGVLAIGTQLSDIVALELRGQYLDYGKGTADAPVGCGLLVPCPTSKKDDIIAGGIGINAYLFQAGTGPYVHGDVLAGDETLYNVGLGWDFAFAKGGIALRAEALYHVQDSDHENVERNYHETQFNLGLRIPLGAPPKEVPLAPAPVPVVVVPPAPQCSDGADNDGDGAIDFPADKGCTDANDNDEYNLLCKLPEPGQPVSLDGCATGDTLVLQGVTFEFDKATLTPNAKTILDGVAEALNKRTDIKVEVAGHTDSKGSDEYNMGLSDRRAKSVKTYLKGKGVAANRITAKGYGETMPIADNETDEGRELNRRVELKVTESTAPVLVAPIASTGESNLGEPAPIAEAPPPAPASESAPVAEPAAAAEPAPVEPAPVAAAEPAPAVASGGMAVTIDNYAFSPASVTVPVGTTVTWTNKDGSNHFVSFADEKSPRLKEGGVFTKTFSTPGTYPYSCTLHPQMTGTVIVQ